MWQPQGGAKQEYLHPGSTSVSWIQTAPGQKAPVLELGNRSPSCPEGVWSPWGRAGTHLKGPETDLTAQAQADLKRRSVEEGGVVAGTGFLVKAQPRSWGGEQCRATRDRSTSPTPAGQR